MNNFTLTVDIGNSNTKCCLFANSGDLLTSFNLEKLNLAIKNYELNRDNTQVISCSVKDKNEELPFKSLDVKTFFKNGKFQDMPVHYNETVGIDRLVAAYGVYKKDNFSKIVIDTGTFTTVDHVDLKGFNGGYILPGLNLLNNNYAQGAQLEIPSDHDCSEIEQVVGLFPQTTKKAIASGALLTFLAPINEVLREHNPQNIIISGGNGEFLYKCLKNSSLCQDASIQFEPNLVNNGLFAISKRIK